MKKYDTNSDSILEYSIEPIPDGNLIFNPTTGAIRGFTESALRDGFVYSWGSNYRLSECDYVLFPSKVNNIEVKTVSLGGTIGSTVIAADCPVGDLGMGLILPYGTENFTVLKMRADTALLPSTVKYVGDPNDNHDYPAVIGTSVVVPGEATFAACSQYWAPYALLEFKNESQGVYELPSTMRELRLDCTSKSTLKIDLGSTVFKFNDFSNKVNIVGSNINMNNIQPRPLREAVLFKVNGEQWVNYKCVKTAIPEKPPQMNGTVVEGSPAFWITMDSTWSINYSGVHQAKHLYVLSESLGKYRKYRNKAKRNIPDN